MPKSILETARRKLEICFAARHRRSAQKGVKDRFTTFGAAPEIVRATDVLIGLRVRWRTEQLKWVGPWVLQLLRNSLLLSLILRTQVSLARRSASV